MKIFFVQLFCVFLPLFFISSVSIRSIPSVLYCAHLCMKCSLGISHFLKEIPSLSLLFFSSISFHWLPRKAFLSLLALFWNFTFKWIYLSFSPLLFPSLLFTAICRPPQTTILLFLHFFFLGMILIPVSHTMSQTSIHSSFGTLSALVPQIYFSLPLYNHKGFILGHTWMLQWFSPVSSI